MAGPFAPRRLPLPASLRSCRHFRVAAFASVRLTVMHSPGTGESKARLRLASWTRLRARRQHFFFELAPGFRAILSAIQTRYCSPRGPIFQVGGDERRIRSIDAD
jgi:hypothetical protein